MFANVYFLPAVWLILSIAVLFFLRWVVFYIMDKMATDVEEMAPIKKFINITTFLVIAVILFFSVLSVIKTVSVNEVPRSVIDRSNINKQQQQFEKAVKKEVEK